MAEMQFLMVVWTLEEMVMENVEASFWGVRLLLKIKEWILHCDSACGIILVY